MSYKYILLSLIAFNSLSFAADPVKTETQVNPYLAATDWNTKMVLFAHIVFNKLYVPAVMDHDLSLNRPRKKQHKPLPAREQKKPTKWKQKQRVHQPQRRGCNHR